MQCVGCSKAPGVCLCWVWWSQGCCRCYSCTRWLVSSFLFTPPMSDPLTTASTLGCFNLTSFRLSLWCKNRGFLGFALCPVLIVHTCLLLLSLNQQFVNSIYLHGEAFLLSRSTSMELSEFILQGKMAGVWSFLITLRVVEAVVGVGVVEVRTWSVMSVVSLVTLLVNVACALVHVAWGVDDVVALAHVDVEVQVMGMDAGAVQGLCLLLLWHKGHNLMNHAILLTYNQSLLLCNCKDMGINLGKSVWCHLFSTRVIYFLSS